MKKHLPCIKHINFLLTLLLVAEDEGFTIGTLDHSRILLMTAYADSFKGTVVALAGVVSTLCYGTFDHAVSILLIHFQYPFKDTSCYGLFLKSYDSFYSMPFPVAEYTDQMYFDEARISRRIRLSAFLACS